MLGAHAAHLVIVETCHMLMNQAIGLPWPDSLEDPHVCAIGRYLDQQDLHHTPLGAAHMAFHRRIAEHGLGSEDWQASAEVLRRWLEAAVVHRPEPLTEASATPRPRAGPAMLPDPGHSGTTTRGCGCHPVFAPVASGQSTRPRPLC